jgi:hypothetical protein
VYARAARALPDHGNFSARRLTAAIISRTAGTDEVRALTEAGQCRRKDAVSVRSQKIRHTLPTPSAMTCPKNQNESRRRASPRIACHWFHWSILRRGLASRRCSAAVASTRVAGNTGRAKFMSRLYGPDRLAMHISPAQRRSDDGRPHDGWDQFKMPIRGQGRSASS